MGRKGICITFMSRERYMEKETQLGTVVTEHWVKLKLASRHNKDHDRVTLGNHLLLAPNCYMTYKEGSHS